jgi:WD40 repeat protein
VKWCTSHDGFWVTASDRGTIITWDPITASPVNSMNYKGRAITGLLIDETNDNLLVCTMHDNFIHVFKLNLGKEVCRYSGHTDQVHAMVYIGTRNQYLSSSWDLTLCVWLAPEPIIESKEIKKDGVTDLKLKMGKGEAPKEKPPDEFELGNENKPQVSKYEKEHPNVMPKILKLHLERKRSGVTDKLMLEANKPTTSTTLKKPVDIVHGSLLEQLIKLEATLNSSI